MRDPDRIDPMLDKLGDLWRAHPDWRLGQLIANLVRVHDGRVDCDPFYIEDSDMDAAMDAAPGQWP